MASKMQDIRPDTLFSFAGEDAHPEEGVASINAPGFRSVGPIIAIEDELSAEVVESTSTRDVIKFWPWVQQVMWQTYDAKAVLTADSGATRPHSRWRRNFH